MIFSRLKRKVLSFFCLTVAIAIIMPVILTSVKSVVKAETKEINVFSWEDYIDEDLLGEFTEETGIKVNYYTFATNEEMYNEITKNPKSCDLVCPSEYMIMKMLEEGMIKPYEEPESYKEYKSPYIDGVFNELKIKQTDGKTYAIGYMWGTMGLLYNAEKDITDEDLNRWSKILGERFKGKITIKDSVRDTYVMALCMVFEDELMEAKSLPYAEYREVITDYLNRTDRETVNKVKDVLLKIKNNLYGFEVDSGKSDILTGKIDVNFAWSGDAVYSMDEGDEDNKTLNYVVPEEASNVWFDGWVMPKEANEEYARAFLDYISRPESAVRNMDYIGYTSCIAGDAVFENVVEWYDAKYMPEIISEDDYNEILSQEEYDALSEEEKKEYDELGIGVKEDYVPYKGGYILLDYYSEVIDDGENCYLRTFSIDEDGNEVDIETVDLYKVDLKYFFDPTCEDDSYVIYSTETGRQLYAQYSDEETISRCVVMQNFNKEVMLRVDDMWKTVKLITLPTWAIILLVCVLALAIVGAVLFKFREKIFVKRTFCNKKNVKKN